MSKSNTPMNPNPEIEVIAKRLVSLGLYGLHVNLANIIHEPWLTSVIELEESERARRSLKRRLTDTRLGSFKSIANFDWSWPAQCDRAQIEELFSLGFIAESANVVMMGPNGLGKSMLIKNLAHHAVVNGHSALFTLASDMLHDLAKQDSSTSLARRLRRYTTPTVLAIDEVGYLSYDARYADLFFEVVSRRYQNRPIVLTTNKAFSAWSEVFPNAACVVTLIDRLIHRAEIVELDGESYRLKEAKERAAIKARARAAGRKPK